LVKDEAGILWFPRGAVCNKLFPEFDGLFAIIIMVELFTAGLLFTIR
jgi:hypothetical protein